jgi:hypothetical protein
MECPEDEKIHVDFERWDLDQAQNLCKKLAFVHELPHSATKQADERTILECIEGLESCVSRRDITDIASDWARELQDHCQLWKKRIDSAERKAKVMFLRMMNTLMKACGSLEVKFVLSSPARANLPKFTK